MKKFVIVLVSFMLSNVLILFAHSQPTHQYIVREAYNLLKKQLGQSIPEIENYIGTTEGSNSDNDWSGDNQALCNPKIVYGAWDEDIHDIVFSYPHDIPWYVYYLFPLPSIIFCDYLGRRAFGSISHFWNPDDNNQFLKNDFHIYIFDNIAVGPYNNAYLKLERSNLVRI